MSDGKETSLDVLKRTKPNPSNFIRKEKGYQEWTFKQLVKYQGYEKAVEICKWYESIVDNEYRFCKLLDTYFDLVGNGYKAFVSEERKYWLRLTLDGKIVGGHEGCKTFRELRDLKKGMKYKIVKHYFL